jgi:hypothetical protein
MCQLLLSGVGYVPTPNVHSDVWNRVESYTIYMLLAGRLKITFTFNLKLIISFLIQLQHLLLSSLLVTSSQVRVGMPLPVWSCCISGLGPEGLLHILPQAVVEASDTFTSWHQTGHKGGLPGFICFESTSGILSMTLSLHSINGLYYYPLDVLAVDSNPPSTLIMLQSPKCL